ncbi:MAG: glycosyltransferase family 4 protein [Actinomycetota bacterium]
MKKVAHVLWRSHGGIRRHVHYVATHPPSGWATSAVFGPSELAGLFSDAPFYATSIGGVLRLAPDADVVHAHGFTAGLCALRPLRPPVVTTLHVVVGSSGRTASSPFSRAVANVALTRADALIAPSAAAARSYPRARVMAPASEPLAVPRLSRGEVRADLDAPADATVVVTVARLDRDKRLDVFIRAVEGSNSIGWIVGDGPERARLEELAVGTRVRLLGHREDIADILFAADLFALPSASESYGIAIAEALEAGLPVVATDTGAHAELIGGAGVVVAPDDHEGFIAAVKRLVHDEVVRSSLASAARGRRRPDPDALIAELGAVYDELDGRRRARA